MVGTHVEYYWHAIIHPVQTCERLELNLAFEEFAQSNQFITNTCLLLHKPKQQGFYLCSEPTHSLIKCDAYESSNH